MPSVLIDLENYFVRLYQTDQVTFNARIESYQRIIAALLQQDKAVTDRLITETIKAFGTGMSSNRYAQHLRDLQKQYNLFPKGLYQDAVDFETQKIEKLVDYLDGFIKELKTYDANSRTTVSDAKTQLLKNDHEESLRSMIGALKFTLEKQAKHKLFGSGLVVNVPLTEAKMRIAADLSNELMELRQGVKALLAELMKERKKERVMMLEDKAYKRNVRDDVNPAWGFAFLLLEAEKKHQELLDKMKVKPGTSGELGRIIKAGFDYLKCYHPATELNARLARAAEGKEPPQPK